MGSIGGVALRTKLESTMASELDKKCTRLCLGKSVVKQNKNLMMLYNYWVITDQCALTDDEINCIVKDVSTSCGFTKPKRLNPVADNVRIDVPQQTITQLTCVVGLTSYAKVTNTTILGDPGNGTAVFNVAASGGTGPYTYLWEAETAVGFPASRTGDIGLITLVDTTTDTLSVSDIDYRQIYQFKITVTDSLGNTCVKTILYDDQIAQLNGY